MREEKKKKRGRVPFFSSIQMKYAMSYLAIVSVVLILLNTYPVLASLLPEGWTAEICIETIEDIPYDTDADVIGIGGMGHAANRGKDIALEFPVVQVIGCVDCHIVAEMAGGLILAYPYVFLCFSAVAVWH